MSSEEVAEGTYPDDYETTTYRGPQEYPVPEDWVLGIVEADGVGWKRYTEAENAHEASKESDLGDDVVFETEPEYASLLNDWNPTSDLVTHTLKVGGEEVFSITGVDDEVLWRSVAEALGQHARGEEVDVDPDAVAVESQKENNASLGDFA